MSTKFYTLLTDIGAAKLASAAALGVPLKITHMAVGDGGGTLPTPDAKQTALVNEKRRAALNMLYIDPQNSSQIIAEQVIPENEGGWWIREVGLFDESGALIAVGNCPESYKPQLAEGSGRTQTVRMVLITSSTDNITLKIDPAVVLATRKYVDDKALELKVYVDDLMAKHLAAPDPHSQYAPKESPTFTGTPKAPTPAAGNNTTQVATTAFVQAALTALINGAPATLDTLKEIAVAINNDPKFSTTINNALALKAPLSSPALTGTPTAPTAAQSVNNTQIATTAFVKSAIAAMVGSAPAALDTLNELAAALGNDPNFATTMLNALAGKQPLDNTLTNLSGKDVAGLLAYGSSNSNQQRVVLAGWRTTGTAATRACFIGQRCGFTYCTVVIFAPHGITDGKCHENCSRCASCTVAVWIIRFTCCCCDVYESTGSTARWTDRRRRGASCACIWSAGDAARCPVCHMALRGCMTAAAIFRAGSLASSVKTGRKLLTARQM